MHLLNELIECLVLVELAPSFLVLLISYSTNQCQCGLVGFLGSDCILITQSCAVACVSKVEDIVIILLFLRGQAVIN